jgi:hypothetical protein
MQRMLGLVDGGKVQAAIVAKLDWLARDLIIQKHIVADLQRRGITRSR